MSTWRHSDGVAVHSLDRQATRRKCGRNRFGSHPTFLPVPSPGTWPPLTPAGRSSFHFWSSAMTEHCPLAHAPDAVDPRSAGGEPVDQDEDPRERGPGRSRRGRHRSPRHGRHEPGGRRLRTPVLQQPPRLGRGGQPGRSAPGDAGLDTRRLIAETPRRPRRSSPGSSSCAGVRGHDRGVHGHEAWTTGADLHRQIDGARWSTPRSRTRSWPRWPSARRSRLEAANSRARLAPTATRSSKASPDCDQIETDEAARGRAGIADSAESGRDPRSP